jgi:hypothetical protein
LSAAAKKVRKTALFKMRRDLVINSIEVHKKIIYHEISFISITIKDVG